LFRLKSTVNRVFSNDRTVATVSCQYQAVGCPWSGKLKELANHTKKCPHKTTEAEKLDLLIKTENEKEKQASRLLENVIDYLKYENVDFHDLTLERTSRFSDGEIDADIMEFESEQFEVAKSADVFCT